MRRLNPDGYESAERLARDLGVNGRSLRSILRGYQLVPGHEEPDGSRYQMDADTAAQIARYPRVAALPRRSP